MSRRVNSQGGQVSQKGFVALDQDTTGAVLASACLEYLKDATSRFDERTTQELVGAIKKASQGAELSLGDKDWTRLADAALTIGSEALDRLTRRITILASASGWSPDFDYRPIATQIHAMSGPARKIRNAIAHRAKCVRAVLKVQTDDKATGYADELANAKYLTIDDVTSWQQGSFKAFELQGTVNLRFHSMYYKEWEEFCKEWNDFNFGKIGLKTSGLESIFEKYISHLSSESSKFKLQWNYPRGPELSFPRKASKDLITFDFKRKVENFTISIRIPNMEQKDFNTISIDLMDLVENTTGLKHIDTLRGGKDADLLNVDVYGNYSMDQLKTVLNEFEKYFEQKYPDGVS
jgi:hypothetical protein